MISQKLQEAINVQIAAEMWSSNLYLSMSFYFKKLGYDGFANWMRKQSQEELEHAYDLADYVSKRGGVAKVDKIDVVPQEWESVLDAFENVYTLENTDKIVKALEERLKDFPEKKDLICRVRESR